MLRNDLLILVLCFMDYMIEIESDKVTLLDTKRDGWNFWKKNTNKFKGWRIQNLPPNGDAVYGVCEIQDSSSDSWLRSPFIQRRDGVNLYVELLFTMRKCDAERRSNNRPNNLGRANYYQSQNGQKSLDHCEETFSMLKYESDQDTDNIEYNSRYFQMVSKVTPNRKWENKDRTEDILNRHISQVNIRRPGVILAFQNTGSCVMLKEVHIYYQRCETMRRKLVEFSQTTSLFRRISVLGRCVNGAIRIDNSPGKTTRNILNFCLNNGHWKYSSSRLLMALTENGLPSICHCSRGFEPENDETNCKKCKYDHYKSHVGLGKCSPCPLNSYSSTGATQCYCKSGFYHVPTIGQSLSCRSTPAKPSSVNINTKDEARIVIYWSPSPHQTYTNQNSQKSISATNQSILHYNISCTNCPNSLQYIPSSSVIGNKVTVLGALPSREYNFKVTTINEVSRYVDNPFDIEQSSSKISILTTPLKSFDNLEIVELKKTNQDKSILVKWQQKPNYQIKVVEYECVLFGLTNKPTDDEHHIRFPQFQQHKFTKSNWIHFQITDQIKFPIFVAKVRSRNRDGWGQYSNYRNLLNNKSQIDPINKKSNTNPQSTNKAKSNVKNATNTHPLNPSIFSVNKNQSKLPVEKSNKSSSNNTGKIPQKDVILLIVGSILLMVVLIIVAGVIIICMRKQMASFSECRNKNGKKMLKIKKKYAESHHTNQVIYSSAYSLARNSYNRYHDPCTYEDISLALQDFTREINTSWIFTDNLIKEGEFSQVYKGVLRIPNDCDKIVAIKLIKTEKSIKEKNDFLIEVSTVGQFNHENLLHLEGVVTMQEPYMMISEYMDNGVLIDYLQANKGDITLAQQLKMLSNIANGMRYLSSMGFIHRDLAARNILLNAQLVCKIADFGLSRMIGGKDDVYCNTNDERISIKWSAPEAILYHNFSSNSDVWSFGVLAWEVLVLGDRPYWQWSDKEVLDAVQSGYRLPLPVSLQCPMALHSLLLQCWDARPNQRPSFTQIYSELENLINNNSNTNNNHIINTLHHPQKQPVLEMGTSEQTELLLMHLNNPNFNESEINSSSPPQPPPPRSNGYIFQPGTPLSTMSSSNNNKYHQNNIVLSSIFPKKNSLSNLLANSNSISNCSNNMPHANNIPIFSDPDYRTMTVTKLTPTNAQLHTSYLQQQQQQQQQQANIRDNSIEALLASVNLQHLASMFQSRYGINTTHQLLQLSPSQFKSIMTQIATKHEQILIQRALTSVVTSSTLFC